MGNNRQTFLSDAQQQCFELGSPQPHASHTSEQGQDAGEEVHGLQPFLAPLLLLLILMHHAVAVARSLPALATFQ